ncbi:DUF1102 domain-containing protein [Halohasta litorea]|uniref:DUF1102 domain-containing protein n=1 Tax=Halohasta litorea TaxID=869891 RepID=A0ABD6D5A7_9EURY|nr:DUF1102 domain-containing protein [Halohasta litorea]
MQRRKFVVGVGSLAASGAAAMGTGAFTSVTASRNVDVAVANDSAAYLGLSSTGGANEEYVTDDGSSGTLSIDLDAGQSVAGGGDGVNPNALTEIDHLFQITNQGTQSVDVSLSKSGDNTDLIGFYAVDSSSVSDPYSNGTQLGSDSVTLDAGESVVVSLQIDTRGSGLGDSAEIISGVTISATA